MGLCDQEQLTLLEDEEAFQMLEQGLKDSTGMKNVFRAEDGREWTALYHIEGAWFWDPEDKETQCPVEGRKWETNKFEKGKQHLTVKVMECGTKEVGT